MRYLLVGNGPLSDNFERVAHNADVIVQFNKCDYAARLPRRRNLIFLANVGIKLPEIIDNLDPRRSEIRKPTIILSRNPLYHNIKKRLLPKHRRYNYNPSQAWRRLADRWPIQTVSFIENCLLEKKLMSMGMPPSFMPSTGMIAYNWVSRRLIQGDSIDIEGFTFEGWEQHPWAIEKQLVKPKEIPFNWHLRAAA